MKGIKANKREEKTRFALTLPIESELWQEDVLDKRFSIATKMYNAVLNKALNGYNEMTKAKTWRDNQIMLSKLFSKGNPDKEEISKYNRTRNDLIKEYKLSCFEFEKIVKQMQRHFKKNIDSHSAQKIALRVWVSISKLLYGSGEKVHFKPWFDGVCSIEDKTNKAGLRYNKNTSILEWNDIKLKVKIDNSNTYETEAIENEICYCRIKRKFIRGKYKYYLDIVLKGYPPIKHKIGHGICGIDIGTQTVAYVTDGNVKLLELADNVVSIDKEKRRIQRYMDRSKRATNPQKFNNNGTFKKDSSKWMFLNKYLKARYKLKDIYRKEADIRKQQHQVLSNEILKQSNICYVEDMNFKALQKRKKKTEVSEKTGKYKRKKRFGKSLAKKAPAMFLTILENKLKFQGGYLIKINTREAKASQYNHLNYEYNKKKLCQRWNYFNYNDNKIKVQRDLYSAFLIKNINEDLSTFKDISNTEFDKFLKYHDEEIYRLSQYKNLSSMGIKTA